MSRRSWASLIAFGLLAVLVVQAARLPVPYVMASPGPTLDVLGEQGGKPIVRVDGHRTYPTEGEIRLTTVSVTNPEKKVNLVEAIGAWMRDDVAVLPYEAMYPEPSTAEEERAESAAAMVGSQDQAIASALTLLGYDLPTYAEVNGVSPGGPSADLLKPRDRILAIDGARIDDVQGVFDTVGQARPGDEVSVRVLRGGTEKTVDVITTAADDDPKRALLGILVGTGYEFPFDVRVALDDSIGGPSAGLMFALSVYDTLTPGALTGGEVVSGTGSISSDGTVGPIGGIRQKIVGAHEAGATIFFVPPDNCAAALLAPVDPDEIELIRADDLKSAIEALETHAANPSADLPRCPA